MRILSAPERAPERILIYGSPKSGKSRLATALPWGEFWGEKAAYIAADPNAQSLRSILLPDREHLTPVVLRSEGKPYDPLHEATAAAIHDWKAEGCGTLIWDTMTATAQDLLLSYAKLCRYASSPITFGRPNSEEFQIQPNEGDYGAAQNAICLHLREKLFSLPINLIVVCHERWVQPKDSTEIIGGPELVGKQSVRLYPGFFDTVIHMENRKIIAPGKNQVEEFWAKTQPHGVWKVGIRTPGVNLPDVKLKEDPRHFWTQYQETLG